jgi:hypothetical protein
MSQKQKHPIGILFLITLLLLHICYIFVDKSRITTIFVTFALLTFGGVLILTKKLYPRHEIFPEIILPAGSNIVCFLLFISPFFIPLFFCSFHKHILFWRFDTAARIALSWFIFSLIWLNLPKAKNDEVGIKGTISPFLLFTVWAAILWLSLIWDVGSRVLFSKAISSEAIVKTDRLASVIYKIWETKPFSEHLGAAFFDYENFKNEAYSHHSSFYLVINYALVKFIQLLINCKMEVATRLVPFFLSILLTVTVAFFSLKTKFNLQIRKISTQLTFFLGLGFLLSLPDFWITLLRYNTDNYFPWISYITLILFTYICINEYISKGFVFVLYFYCLLSPLYAVISLFTFCFFVFTPQVLHKDKLPSIKLITILSVGLMLAGISFAYPYVVIGILKYKEVGSSLLFRSGLDGDTSYYNNIWQAVTNPCNKSLIRPWSSLIPAIVFCTSAFMLGGLRKYKKGSGELMNSIFLFSPYLFSIVVFPQAVSIHPYSYDYLLLFPLVFLGVYWLCSQEFQEKIKGPWLYLLFLFMMSFIIYNLTKIAQAARNLPF